MPFAFIVLGLIMVVTGARNTYRQFGAQVAKDFTGPNNFTWWIASLVAVGMLGYLSDRLKPVSTAFMTLIIVVLIVSAKSLFPKLTEALRQGPVAPKAEADASASAPGIVGGAASIFGSAASLLPSVNVSAGGLDMTPGMLSRMR